MTDVDSDRKELSGGADDLDVSDAEIEEASRSALEACLGDPDRVAAVVSDGCSSSSACVTVNVVIEGSSGDKGGKKDE